MARERHGSQLWESPQVIESYCAKSAGVLSEYLDAMFEDLKGPIRMGTQCQSSDATSTSPLETRRLAMDSTYLPMRLIKMQLEVLRQVMERKEEELRGLVAKRSIHLKEANDQLTSKSLPSLPIEILAQIFRSLYNIESRDTGSYHWDDTIWKLMHDKHAPSAFRHIIRSEIPVVVTQAEIGRMYSELSLPDVRVLLGGQPRTFQPQQLDSIVMSSSSTTVMITAEGWPELKEGLHELCVEFHGVVLSLLTIATSIVLN